jgi:capsular polysaccharide transport system permease protein
LLDRPPAAPGFVDHLFIVRALILRDLRLKYWDNPFGFVMELIRPVAVMVAHYYLFYLMRRPMPGKIPIEVFVIAGFSVWFTFNYTAQGAINGGRWPAGATALPGVTRMHMRLARGGWTLLLNLVFCLTATLPLTLYGDTLPVPDLLLTFAIFSMAGAMGFGFGLFMDQLGHLWPVIKPLEKLLTWVLFVTCALYFSLATTVPMLANVLWYNPLLHLVEYERHAFDPGYPVALVTLTYPAVFSIGLLFAGLLAIRSFGLQAHE